MQLWFETEFAVFISSVDFLFLIWSCSFSMAPSLLCANASLIAFLHLIFFLPRRIGFHQRFMLFDRRFLLRKLRFDEHFVSDSVFACIVLRFFSSGNCYCRWVLMGKFAACARFMWDERGAADDQLCNLCNYYCSYFWRRRRSSATTTNNWPAGMEQMQPPIRWCRRGACIKHSSHTECHGARSQSKLAY